MNWQRILTATPTERIHFWSISFFTAHSVTYNISEMLTAKELETICLQIQSLTDETRNDNLHFVIIFPDNAAALFFLPKRGMFSDITNKAMPEELEHAKKRITETAQNIIKRYNKGVSNGTNKTTPVR